MTCDRHALPWRPGRQQDVSNVDTKPGLWTGVNKLKVWEMELEGVNRARRRVTMEDETLNEVVMYGRG